MKPPVQHNSLRFSPAPWAVLAVFVLGLPACLVTPPSALVHAEEGIVRGSTELEARALGLQLDRLKPRVECCLPGTRSVDGLEVWIQDKPGLYAFPHQSNGEAEGLWAESHDRILLARDADDLERTLAHELVHAALDESWRTLPGTLEEGLADQISTQLVPEGATRLRAGRLASAALATGGLGLTLEVENLEHQTTWMARITLSGSRPSAEPQRDVFRLAAGLSSTRVTPASKRGYYGLAFLLVNRIVERQGVEHLHNLCVSAAEQGLSQVPRPWLLAAADLADSAEAWRQAALERMGAAELRELMRMHPDFVHDAVLDHLRSRGHEDLDHLRIRLTLRESATTLDLHADEPFTNRLRAALISTAE